MRAGLGGDEEEERQREGDEEEKRAKKEEGKRKRELRQQVRGNKGQGDGEQLVQQLKRMTKETTEMKKEKELSAMVKREEVVDVEMKSPSPPRAAADVEMKESVQSQSQEGLNDLPSSSCSSDESSDGYVKGRPSVDDVVAHRRWEKKQSRKGPKAERKRTRLVNGPSKREMAREAKLRAIYESGEYDKPECRELSNQDRRILGLPKRPKNWRALRQRERKLIEDAARAEERRKTEQAEAPEERKGEEQQAIPKTQCSQPLPITAAASYTMPQHSFAVGQHLPVYPMQPLPLLPRSLLRHGSMSFPPAAPFASHPFHLSNRILNVRRDVSPMQPHPPLPVPLLPPQSLPVPLVPPNGLYLPVPLLPPQLHHNGIASNGSMLM
jgi:hypothetical protein